jgi:hypothetical protein
MLALKTGAHQVPREREREGARESERERARARERERERAREMVQTGLLWPDFTS